MKKLDLSENARTTATFSDDVGMLSSTGLAVLGSASSASYSDNQQILGFNQNETANLYDSPELSSPGTLVATIEYLEFDQEPPISASYPDITLSDSGVLSGETFTVTVSDMDGYLSLSGPNGLGSKSLSISGSLSQVNAELSAISYYPTSASPDIITAQVSDSLGYISNTVSIYVTINAVESGFEPNDLPITVGLGQPTSVSFPFGPTDGPDAPFATVTVSDTFGILSAPGPGVSGSGTTAIVISGSFDQVISALYSLKVTESTLTSDTITFNGSDSYGNTEQQTNAISVAGPPKISLNQPVVVGVGQPYNILFAVSETNISSAEQFSTYVSDNTGQLSLPGAYEFSGSSLAFQSYGGAGGSLKILESETGSDTITITSTDNFGNTSGPVTFPVTINGLPSVTYSPALDLTQGRAASLYVSLSETGITTGETFTVTLSDTNGLLSLGASSSGSTSLTITGSLAQVNADLATVTDRDFVAGSDAVTIVASDGFGNSSAPATVQVTTVPTLTLSITTPPLEIAAYDSATPVTGVSIEEPGALTGETFSVTLNDTYGVLAANGAGVTGSGTNSVSISGTLAQVQADLASLTDTDAYLGNDTISVTASDSLGNVAAAASTVVVIANYPTLIAPASLTIGQGQPGLLSGLSISEPDVQPSEVFYVSLSDQLGTLTATGAGVSGSGSTSLSVTGSFALVNADLATVTDTDSVLSADALSFSAYNSIGFTASAVTAAITVNGPPVILVPAPVLTATSSLVNLSEVSLAESGNTSGEDFTIDVSAAHGTLSDPLSAVSGGALSFTGLLSQVNTELAELVDTVPGLADTINITAFDSFGNVATSRSITIACYLRGTRIATPGGDIAIESLRIHDLVLNQTGTTRTIRWIGRRSYAGRFVARNPDIQPVRIRASALADGVPRRDLFVSPLHAMYLDGVLVPALELVNGATIMQLDVIDTVEYFHIELDTHDVILAEGAPSESFVDDDSRGMFHNGNEYVALYPNAPRRPALYCAPRVTDGYKLAAVRDRLAVRAALQQAKAVAPLRGFVDLVDGDLVEGWAQNPNEPEAPVCLDVLVEGVVVAQAVANRYRTGLSAATGGSGRHAFFVRLPFVLTPRQCELTEVRRSSDHAPLERHRLHRDCEAA